MITEKFLYFFPRVVFSGAGRGLRRMLSAALLMTACGAGAQQLPEAPRAVVQPQTAGTNGGLPRTQSKPLFSLLPNLGSERVGEKLPPQTVKEKFMVPTRRTLNAWAVGKPALASLFKESIGTVPEFGRGATGFGRYYWHTVVDETSENYLVRFVLPVMTHQDTRYYALGPGNGFWRRTEYALSRTMVTRDDAGREVFNSSEVVGAGVAAGLANLYYPSEERTLSKTTKHWGMDVGFDALAFGVREFWPDVRQKLFKGRK